MVSDLPNGLGPIRQPSGEIVSIQQLRGLAAGAVLCFHACQRAGLEFGVGAAGVDVFFAISGFIMWVVTARGELKPWVFLKRRVVRIVPLYWLVTLATAALAVAAPRLFPAMRPTLSHVVQSLLFVPHADPDGQTYPLLVPGWTLNYEAFFYLVFAAALFAAARARAVLVTVALGALVMLRPLLAHAGPAAATYTDPLMLEFVAGVWLGVAWTHGRLLPAWLGWLAVGVGVCAFAALELGGVDVASWRAAGWGLPAFLIVAGSVSVERAGRMPKLGALERLGDASYALYLVHGLVVSAAARALEIVHLRSPWVIATCAIVAGLLAGLAAHRGIERPLLSLFRRRSAKSAPSGALAPSRPAS